MPATVANNSAFGGPNAQQAANGNAALGIQPSMPNYIGTGTQTQQPTTEQGQNDTSYVGQNGITYNNRTGLPISQSPLMTAQVATPISYGNNPAPAVYNASQATSYLGNVGTQIQNLNNDSTAQSQSIANNNANAQAAQQPQGQSETQGQDNGQTQTDTTDPAAQLNQQISDILTNLGQGEENIDSQEQGQQTLDNEGQPATFQQALAENQVQQIGMYQQYSGMLQQIQNGTFPLSQPEQTLLTSTQNQFQSAISAQLVANQAFSGQITESMASLGINQTAPTEALGAIYGAISTGNSKISDLDNQMAQTTAQLQNSFQTQNYQQVMDSWNMISKQFSDRQTALTQMQSSVNDALNQQKSDMVDYAKTAISAIQSVATMTYNEKQDTIKNALDQAQFTETQRSDLVNEQQKQESINLQAQAQQQIDTGTNNLPQVSMTASNTPSQSDQAAFLAQLSPTVATEIQGIADYSISPSSYSTSAKQAQGGLTQGQLVALAKQYNPAYDEAQYSTRQALLKNFQAGGTYGKNVVALNTATGHLASLASDLTQLGNTNFSPYNAVKNSVGPIFGANPQSGAKLDIAAVTGELASAFKASGATDSEISALGTIGPNSTPNDVKNYISAATDLMGSKLGALDDAYTSGMGEAPPGGTLMSDTAAAALLKLQSQGYDIKTPELANTSVGKLATFGQANPSEQAKISQMESDGVSYDDIAAYYGLQ